MIDPNTKDSNFTIASILSVFLALLFCGCILFAMFAIAQVQNYSAFGAVLTFSVINMIIILILAVIGKYLSQTIATASFISICSTTVIYTLLQFVHMLFSYKTISTNGYILYHLVVLFLYLLIVIPAALMGTKKKY